MKIPSDIFEYKILIQEHHLDTFAHVNNAKYLEIYEDARWDLITQHGYGLTEVHLKKIGPIILGVNLQFKKELKNRDAITVTTQCTTYEGKVGQLVQRMIKENGDEASIATFTFGLFDFTKRKLILPTSDWLKAIGIEE
jgi:YbgC/YbaW family acyl-CoA thioester hydrolase